MRADSNASRSEQGVREARVSPAVASTSWRALLVFLLAVVLNACGASGSPSTHDASSRDGASSDRAALERDLAITDGSFGAPDGGWPEAGATHEVNDSAGDIGRGDDRAAIVDTVAGLDGLDPGDAEADIPLSTADQDASWDEPAADAELSDISSSGDDRDSGRLDVQPAMAFDLAPDAVENRDRVSDINDAPLVNTDSAPDAGPDTRDAAVGSPDSSDSRAGVDGASASDARDGASVDGDEGDGGEGSCCGCLCQDPSWSCSQDTCLDPAGNALTLAAESGFFELPGGSYVSEDQTRTSPTHRIWYSFQPAATSPESKPLAVFFNGGPGSATSVYLFTLNTGPNTLDPAFTGTAKIAANPNSWTAFANLLYIDAPGTGFSYPLALANGSKPSVGIDLDRDAGAVLRVVVRFLDRHPRLRANPVIIVGESYGGTRATLMLDHVLNYQTLAGTAAAYRDADLYNDLVAHFAAVWPQDNPQALPASRIATQFGWQVLIQPVVAGDAQWTRQTHDPSGCRSSPYDKYQCDEPYGFTDQTAATAAQNMTTLATLRQALGVDPSSIEWLHARARKTAYGRGDGTVISTPEMAATFGTLGSDDNYLLEFNRAAGSTYGGYARGWQDSTIGSTFLNDLVYVKTFITNAKLDMVVSTPAIAPALASFSSTVASSEIDSAPRAGITRPGWIKVTYLSAVLPAPSTREIRYPTYDKAGHTVSLRDSANLLADVTQWYAANHAHAERVPDETPGMVTGPRKLPAAVPDQPMLYIGP